MSLLLQPAKITSAYLKMGILGFQGGGKTKTAGKTAIGLYKYMQSKGIDCQSHSLTRKPGRTGLSPTLRKPACRSSSPSDAASPIFWQS